MLGTFVPFRAILRQPLTFTISLLGSVLSFTMTLRFCQRHWPEDGGLMLVALGLLWELAKLHLAARGLAAVVHGCRASERFGGLGLLIVALALAAGSVGASVGCLLQVEAQDQKRSLASSHAYARAVRELEALDSQIAFLAEAAAHDLDHGYRKRALDTSQKVDELRPRRDVAERKVRGLELKGDAAALSLDGDLGRLLGSSGRFGPRSLRLVLHLAVAVLLEVISMVGMFLLERGFHPPTAALAGHPPRSRARSSPSTRRPPPSPVRARTDQDVEARPYTHRLTYRFGRAEGLLNQLGTSRRYQACRELMRRIGDYCLKIGWTNGVITEAQLRTLSTGASWRATQGHVGLLLDVCAITQREDGCYEIAYFLDENPSVQTREAYAQQQRDLARSRKQRERSRGKVESTLNQHISDTENTEKSETCVTRHAKPTTTHQKDANAAPHRIATHAEATEAAERFEEALPWTKYMHVEPAAGEAAEDIENPPGPKPPPERLRASGPRTHRCIPAKFRDTKEALNLGCVVEGLRKQGIDENPGLAEQIFRDLRRAGVTRAQLRYATHCLLVRRQKVEVDNSVAYWTAIARYQGEAARVNAGSVQLVA
jgi:hypothetical protein